MRLAILLLVLVASCHDSASPPEPRWQRGPGCEIHFMYELEPGIFEIVIQRFESCPRIIYDSTLVR